MNPPNSEVNTPIINIAAPINSKFDSISDINISAKNDAKIGSKLKIKAAFTGVV